MLMMCLVLLGWPSERSYEPIILKGNQLSEFNGVQVDAIGGYAWDGQQFLPVLIQIDEILAGSYFNTDDGLWDFDDELCVLASALGDPAPPFAWIDDVQALQGARIEVAVFDPVSTETAYLYLFEQTPVVRGGQDLVSYDAINDVVTTPHYVAGFDQDNGVMNRFQFVVNQTPGPDLMDREKLRVSGELDIPPIPVPFDITEEDVSVLATLAVDGPLRVIRGAELEISLGPFSETFTSIRPYYPALLTGNSYTINIFEGYGITAVRISMDLSADATGAIRSDPNNPGLLVDGSADGTGPEPTPTQLENYWMLTEFGGRHLVLAGDFEEIGDTTELYYRDDENGGTSDGTIDTGDLVSFGDMGLLFSSITTDGRVDVTSILAVDTSGNLTGPELAAHISQQVQTTITANTPAQALDASFPLWRQIPNPFGGPPVDVIDLIPLVIDPGV